MSVLTAHVALVSETSQITFKQLAPVAAALQKQVTRDFGPLWQVNSTVDAFDSLDSVPVDYWPVIIRDDINEPGAAGFHTDDQGQPFSLVQFDSDWSVTTSHETLEMLADPDGNRTVAGDPPPQLAETDNELNLERVIYLVEVCDPCETITYKSNGQRVSDFITPHYYDPDAGAHVRYSFRGKIQQPHQVLDGGYVSFGDPATNNWYQIIVQDGNPQLRELGQLQAHRGTSLRELVDGRVRHIRADERYRLKPAAAVAAAASTASKEAVPFSVQSVARAKSLREFVRKLK
jgi:hypothetical protein